MSNINVVIADDNERIRQNLQEIVSRECDMTLVGSASDGMDALSMIRTSHPDVVLLDIIMPKMDGLGVLEEVKKDENLLKKPAFIILTALGQEEVMEEAMEEASIDNTTVEEVEDDAQEVTVITKGTTINGGIKSDTSLVVKGTIEGDVECEGKLTITGKVAGNTIASEIYVNTPRLEGDINSRGIVKIDVGTVVIGSISCTSVLVAGAVKGNIEVNGPVIVDSTAVVKGDIKAKSIQINSGAVIDGHCSLAYADVDLDSFFE